MHNTPSFLLDALTEQYGADTAERICAGYEKRRAVSARVNTIKTTPESVLASLADVGISTRTVPWSDTALILDDTDEAAVAETDVYGEGHIYLQSLSSMIPVMFLGATAGENILDMAAAPGGKTTQIAAMTDNGAFITACEKNKIRAQRLQYNINKQGARRTTVMVKDARELDALFTFDRILLDAPCSGSGTLELWRDKPPAITEELIQRSVKTQRALLRAALSHLRTGSELLYSTCSVLKEENEEQIRSLVKSGRAEIVPLDASLLPGVPLLPTTLEGTLCVCPDEEYEGFFIAKVRKK